VVLVTVLHVIVGTVAGAIVVVVVVVAKVLFATVAVAKKGFSLARSVSERDGILIRLIAYVKRCDVSLIIF
jgi:hypothetical protein